MSVRVPLPNRRELQNLTGLIQAIKYHMNVASNVIITDDSALGYVNACEDIDLIPLKSFHMKRSEKIALDCNGRYRINNLKYPATEITGLYMDICGLYNQRMYLQYVDPITFGKGYGSVFAQALYTIMTADDGTNDQVLCVYPVSPSTAIGVEYYCDWPKLGDLTTNSRLQSTVVTFSGIATAPGSIQYTTTIDGNTTDYSTIPVKVGDTGSSVGNKMLTKNNIPFRMLPGNNATFWNSTRVVGSNSITLESPEYISSVATLNIGAIPAGLSVSQQTTVQPFVQTVQSNWFLYQFPYVYYYGALRHAYNGLEDADRYALVEKDWLKAVQVFQAFTDRAEFAGSGQQPDYCQNVIW